MADSIEELSFELSANALSQQEHAVANLRACAGTVLGAASIAGSFLRVTAGAGALDVWGILATISFGLCFGSAIWVLAPHKLAVAFGGYELLEESHRRGRSELTDAYRAAGRWLEPRLQANHRTITRLADWLTVSCVWLAIEVILWTLSLTG